MKILFVEAKSRKKAVPFGAEIPFRKIGLVSAVQFAWQLDEIKKFLEKKGKKAFIGKPSRHAVLRGQILGCDASSAENIEEKVECFLYVGTGEFHPLGLRTGKPIFILNPFTKKISRIPEESIKLEKKKQQIRILKFKEAKIIGILVSTKYGQERIREAECLKAKLEKARKEAYLFICGTIIPNELLNFPQIECWANTACPRIDDSELYNNKPIVNFEDVQNL